MAMAALMATAAVMASGGSASPKLAALVATAALSGGINGDWRQCVAKAGGIDGDGGIVWRH